MFKNIIKESGPRMTKEGLQRFVSCLAKSSCSKMMFYQSKRESAQPGVGRSKLAQPLQAGDVICELDSHTLVLGQWDTPANTLRSRARYRGHGHPLIHLWNPQTGPAGRMRPPAAFSPYRKALRGCQPLPATACSSPSPAAGPQGGDG